MSCCVFKRCLPSPWLNRAWGCTIYWYTFLCIQLYTLSYGLATFCYDLLQKWRDFSEDLALMSLWFPQVLLRPPHMVSYTHFGHAWAVREITKSSSTFSATNISSNMICFFQLHDTIKMKSNHTGINYRHNGIAIRSHVMKYNSVLKFNFCYQI